MKQNSTTARAAITALILLAGIGYGVFYFNYFETPSGDYIGNIRGPVLQYMGGDFPGTNFKFLPFFPLLLSVLTRVNPFPAEDPVYLTAMILNMALLLPYLVLAFLVYRRFLAEKAAMAALIILGTNIYTVYMAVNAELEMTLTTMILLSLYLALRDSKLSYATAFFTAFTKWDSVFIVPAVMFRDFFYRNKKPLSLVLGTLAAAGVVTWLALSFMATKSHPYVAEIAHRGPNVYRYILDCFLVAGSFIQWMAGHAWYMQNTALKLSMLAFLAIPAAAVIIGIPWGMVLVWKKQRREFAPVLMFFAGFLLIHLVYQNTKDRYVMPILWILTLFLVTGVTGGLWPRLSAAWDRMKPKTRVAAAALLGAAAAALYAATLAAIAIDDTPAHVAFALAFTALMAAVVTCGSGRQKIASAAFIALACGVLINLSVYYGVRALDHHGLSRVEFKQAALWFRENAGPRDRMLISETNVPMYYSGFGPERFAVSFFINGKTVEELVPELRAMKVTHVFVDDFYIRRLPIKDPNAIDRRAWVFKEIRDRGAQSGHFTLIRTFHTKGGITSYLYRFVP